MDMMSGGGGGGGGGGMSMPGANQPPGGGATQIGMGLAKYLSAIQANRNARALNATSSKWAPLLKLNKSQGFGNVEVPTAAFDRIMGPAIISAMNTGGPSGTPGAGGGGGGGGSGSSGGGPNLGVDTSMPMLPDDMKFADGGEIAPNGPDRIHLQEMIDDAKAAEPPPAKEGGGDKGGGGGGLQSMMSMLPMLAMLLSEGGQVPGKAKVPGNSPKNDTQLALTSPGEVVLPRDVAQEGLKGNKWKVAAYLNKVKQHGPGPMPPSGSKPKSPSMSPWSAMCSGGMVGR